MQRFK